MKQSLAINYFKFAKCFLGQFVKAFIIKIKEADGTCRKNNILQLLQLFDILKGLTKAK